jgi:hypothetical protein
MTRRRVQDVIRAELDWRADHESDVQYRQYVQPYGTTGMHIVKNRADGQEYVVSGPATTFAPGTILPVARNLSDQNETIIQNPPPGRRGAAPLPPQEIVLPPRPNIDGDFGHDWSFTSSAQVARFTSSITGTGFSSQNFIEIIDVRDSQAAGFPSTENPFTITGLSFISSTQWDVQLYSPASYNVYYRFKVWSSSGSVLWADGAEHIEDDDPSIDGYWLSEGV